MELFRTIRTRFRFLIIVLILGWTVYGIISISSFTSASQGYSLSNRFIAYKEFLSDQLILIRESLVETKTAAAQASTETTETKSRRKIGFRSTEFPGEDQKGMSGAQLDSSQKWSFQLQEDAPPCPDCGSIMIRNGVCYKCVNCGTPSGCS